MIDAGVMTSSLLHALVGSSLETYYYFNKLFLLGATFSPNIILQPAGILLICLFLLEPNNSISMGIVGYQSIGTDAQKEATVVCSSL